MAEMLRTFDEPIRHSSGTFHARVVGRLAEDGMWEGWLEFVPLGPDGGKTVVSAVESRQAAKQHLQYWSQGLTMVYAQGLLDRALHPLMGVTRVGETPASSRPASRVAILDPFEIGARNLDILAQELHALNRPRLLNIISAYDLNPGGAELAPMTDRRLIGFIVAAVETRLLQRAH